MSFNKPAEIAEIAVNVGVEKIASPIKKMLVLGFLGGAFIALGFLLDIRVMAAMPAEWGSFITLIGASVFPLGLILVLLAGADLITGNMMTVPLALYARKITFTQLCINWFWVTLANLLGALFVAFAFGHFLGLTETGPFLDKTIAVADAKIGDSFLHTFVSGIGCNWLVCLAVWLSFGAQDFIGKIVGIWFPVMAFVTLGFQHVVANMFVIPAAIFAGHATWADLVSNVVPAFLGNAVGGAIFVGAIYFVAYNKKKAVAK